MGGNVSSHHNVKNKYIKDRLKKFDPNEIEMLHKIYKELSTRSGTNGIDKETFLQYFNLPGLWGEQLFRKFDCNYSGAVELEEFLLGISVSCRGTRSEKIYVLFKLFDLNNDNLIHKFELLAMLSNFPQLTKYLYTSIDNADSMFNTRNRNLKILDRNFKLNTIMFNPMSMNYDFQKDYRTSNMSTNKFFNVKKALTNDTLSNGPSENENTFMTRKKNGANSVSNEMISKSLSDFSFDSKSLSIYINKYYNDGHDVTHENYNYVSPNYVSNNKRLPKHSNSLSRINDQPDFNDFFPNKYRIYLDKFDSFSYNGSDSDPEFNISGSHSSLETWNEEEFSDVNNFTNNDDPSSILVKSIINEYSQQEHLDKATVDLEILVDHIFEECEFNETGSLNFQKFKAWLEKNDSILTMFSECLHEEVWGLHGHAFHHERSISLDSFDKMNFNYINYSHDKLDSSITYSDQDMDLDEITIRTIYQIFLVKGKHPFAYTMENNPNLQVSPELLEHIKTINKDIDSSTLNLDKPLKSRQTLENTDKFLYEIFACPNCKTPFFMCPVCYKKHNALSLHIETNNVYISCSECCSSNETDIGIFKSCWICCWSFNDIFNAQPIAARPNSFDRSSSNHSDSHSINKSSNDSKVSKSNSDYMLKSSNSLSSIANKNLNLNISSKSGLMFKIGRTLHQWKSRYYVLIGNILYYYKDKTSTRPRGCIFLEGCYLFSHRKKQIGNKYGFSICHKGNKSSKRDFYVDSMHDFMEWVEALTHAMKQQSISNSYEVYETLGQGKFSKVYRASSRKTGVEYAIKIIDKNKITQQERELLRSEISILKLLKHNNVIYLKEIIDMKDTLYIVMELVRGGELYDLIHSEHRLSEAHTHRIISQLLHTVAYLHKCGIVHRDLKPENLLLTDRSESASIKLTDFGLSTLCGPNDILIQPCGTLAYVAPEVLTMQGYNQKSDVWSIGVIMYLLIRGRLPFPIKRSNNVNICEHYKLVFDGNVWKTVSSSAKDLIKKLLEVDPMRRLSVFQALDHIWVKNFVAVNQDSSTSVTMPNAGESDDFYQTLMNSTDTTFVLPYSESCNRNLNTLSKVNDAKSLSKDIEQKLLRK